MPTLKQTKLIELLKENMSDTDSTLTLGELLLKAGYTEATAKNAYLIFESKAIKQATGDISNMLDNKRKMAITQITEKKLKDAPARELAYVVDTFTKNIQLLNGKSTDNVGINIQISESIARKYQSLEESSQK
jgi:hypothetical protein